MLASKAARVLLAVTGLAALGVSPGSAELWVGPCYRSWDQVRQDLDRLANRDPSLQKLEIGASWLEAERAAGDPIEVWHLDRTRGRAPRAHLVVVAGTHPRELAPVEVAARFLETLATTRDTDVLNRLAATEVHVLPMHNPDGRRLVEAGASRRKNVNPAGCSDDQGGVDLNRNGSFGWSDDFASSDACSETFRGPAPASEPETRALEAYLDRLFRDQATPGLVLALHAPGDLVLYPWEGRRGAAPDVEALAGLAQALAGAGGLEACRECLPPASGTLVDFAYGALGRPALTIEIGPSFTPACSDLEETLLPRGLAVLEKGLELAPSALGDGLSERARRVAFAAGRRDQPQRAGADPAAH